MMTSNLESLVEAGVIPADSVDDLTDDDLTAIESMSQEEVTSVITITRKLGGKDFFKKLCPHGAFF